MQKLLTAQSRFDRADSTKHFRRKNLKIRHSFDASTKAKVLIVGAGPTGLVLAIWLRKNGIDVRIIDKSAKPGTTSRAIAVQARTLEFYRQLGFADKLIEAGVTAEQVTLRRSGKAIAHVHFGAPGKGMSPYPYLLFCPQDVHEGILCDQLRILGVEVERNSELLELTQDKEFVTATIKNENGIEIVTTEYLCGCDGAHSVVRRQLPTQFEGGTYEHLFFVADVMAIGEASNSGVHLTVSKKDFCIVMPVKSQGSVRLTGIVPPENEKKEVPTFADVEKSVQRNSGLTVQKVNWFSSYRVHHRVADKFQNNRVFLSGDAGHIHSPAGGQGMNTGIGDAVNLGWKLSDVIAGKFSDRLLLSYEIERIAFAKVLVKTTDTAFKIIASQSFLGAIFRAYIFPYAFSFLTGIKPFLTLAFRVVSQIRIRYPNSPISKGKAGKINGGDRLPWIQLPSGDNYDPLKSLNWQIHIYGQANDEFKESVKDTTWPLFIFEWNADAEKKGLFKNGVYLIRPDGYVALASEKQNSTEIKSFIGLNLL